MEDGKICILVVDDDAQIVSFVTQMLSAQGYAVRPAVGALKAVETFEAATDAIDVLLSDVVMPEMNGPELARKLQSDKPGMPVLFMTGYSDVLDGTPVIEKPFGYFDLQRAISRAIALAANRGLPAD